MKRRHAQALVAEWAAYGVTEAECREFAPWAFPEPPVVKTPAGCATLPEDRRWTFNELSGGTRKTEERRVLPGQFRLELLDRLRQFATMD